MRRPRAVRTCVALHEWYLVTHSTYPRSASSSFVPCSPIQAEHMCRPLPRPCAHRKPGVRHGCMPMHSFVRSFVFWFIRSLVDAASKHGCFIPLCLRWACCREAAWAGWVVRMSETVLSRSGQALGCSGAAAKEGGVCFSRPRIFHSNTNVTATQMKCRDISLH